MAPIVHLAGLQGVQDVEALLFCLGDCCLKFGRWGCEDLCPRREGMPNLCSGSITLAQETTLSKLAFYIHYFPVLLVVLPTT